MMLHKRKRFAGHDPVRGVSLFETCCGVKVRMSDIEDEREEITCVTCLHHAKLELSREVKSAKMKHDRLVEKLITLRVRIKEMERATQ